MLKKFLLVIFCCFLLLPLFNAETKGDSGVKFDQEKLNKKVVVKLSGTNISVFNGIPVENGWGRDLVYPVNETSADKRTMGPLGGIPLVDIWNEGGGIAVYNTQLYQEPFSVEIKYDKTGVTLVASGASKIEVLKHRGDYYDAIRAFALKMKQKGLAVQPAPKWAFDAIWETYGFEEDFDKDTIIERLPLLKKLGIKTITIDSGWYGEGRGEDINFNTGDFKINPDVIGSEKDWIQLIDHLHNEGFRVRIWWVPGVAEAETELWNKHPGWFTHDVVSSTGDTGDIYLDPNNRQVLEWRDKLINRFLSYGVDGFKQDDIYHYVSSQPKNHRAYAELINNNLTIAQLIKKDFSINTCNCGVAQNFYQISGQNQLITSDPVGSKQFRRRAKYLHALNVNGAAILGDHVELSKGDVGPEEMDEAGFYDSVDFHSIVPLGMVLQTKFRHDPGPLYNLWFKIYNEYQFYNMQWVNIPLRGRGLETYLMRDKERLYFTFFSEQKNNPFDGKVDLSHLVPGRRYQIYNIVNNKKIMTFSANQTTYSLSVNFNRHLTIGVVPIGNIN